MPELSGHVVHLYWQVTVIYYHSLQLYKRLTNAALGTLPLNITSKSWVLSAVLKKMKNWVALASVVFLLSTFFGYANPASLQDEESDLSNLPNDLTDQRNEHVLVDNYRSAIMII